MITARFPSTCWRALLIGLLLAVGACGGGVETGGTGAYVQGPVTGFGSVIVAGVRFDDGNARIEDADGTARRRDELRLGMLVEIESGPIGDDGSGGRTATATRVRLASELLGPVDAVELSQSRIVVLGQPVRISAATVVDGVGGGAGALLAGDVVEVHGFFDPAGSYVATRIERRAGTPATYRLRGIARELDAAARTLRVGAQVFDLAASGVPAGLANGQFVRLTLQTAQAGGRWRAVAAAIEVRGAGDRDVAEIEGLISAFSGPAQFSVNGVRVDASAASFVDGTAGLATGVRVRVRGRSQGGVLVAGSVDIRSDGETFGEGFDIRDSIAGVDAAGSTFVLRGITVFYGSVPAPRVDNGTVADLAPGRHVRVRGTLAADRTRVVATRIEFVDN